MAERDHADPSKKLFRLCFLAGLVPLLVLAAAWLGREPSWQALRVAGIATGIGAAILLALQKALVGILLRETAKSTGELKAVTARVADRDFSARAEIAGPGREFRRFNRELNSLIETHQLEVLNHELELRQASELRTASKKLIEECIFAREPLSKQHPDLAGAYAEAAIRHSGSLQTPDTTVDALVYGVDHASDHKGNRENLRWTLPDVTVEVPVPSRLLNMSVSGMAVESNRGLPVGGSWVFRIGNGAFAYDIPGKVRWCRLDRTVRVSEEVRPIYRTGVAFDSRLTGRAFDFFSPAVPVSGAHAVASS